MFKVVKVLKNAPWRASLKNKHVYITANYEGLDVSIRDDDTFLVVMKNGKKVAEYDVGGMEEFEALFGIFWGYGSFLAIR